MWKNLFAEFIADLRLQKLRASLTIIAITWGTFAVILLLAFGEGLGNRMLEGMLGAGNQVMILYPGQTTINHEGLGVGRPIRFVEEDVDLIQNSVPHIAFISPQYGRWGIRLKTDAAATSTYGEGVNPGFEDMRTMYPASGGRFISERDVTEQRRVVFVGNELAARLFPGENAVGKSVLVDDMPFTVIGVMQPKLQTSMNNGPDANRIIIPHTTFRNMYGNRYLGSILIRPTSPEHQLEVKAAVTDLLARKYKFDPTDKNAIFVWDFIEQENISRKVSAGVTIFLFVVGLFTLLIAGVGVANIMYVVVKERTREIGVKKAMGARNRHIMAQFIFEAISISALGGLFGLLISWGIVAFILSLNLNDGAGQFLGSPVISAEAIYLTIGTLSLIGFLAGVFPARKATKVQPVESLRYE